MDLPENNIFQFFYRPFVQKQRWLLFEGSGFFKIPISFEVKSIFYKNQNIYHGLPKIHEIQDEVPCTKK